MPWDQWDPLDQQDQLRETVVIWSGYTVYSIHSLCENRFVWLLWYLLHISCTYEKVRWTDMTSWTSLCPLSDCNFVDSGWSFAGGSVWKPWSCWWVVLVCFYFIRILTTRMESNEQCITFVLWRSIGMAWNSWNIWIWCIYSIESWYVLTCVFFKVPFGEALLKLHSQATRGRKPWDIQPTNFSLLPLIIFNLQRILADISRYAGGVDPCFQGFAHDLAISMTLVSLLQMRWIEMIWSTKCSQITWPKHTWPNLAWFWMILECSDVQS